MKILIISHFFRPYNHIASNRIDAINDYLKQLGHTVYLVTLDREIENTLPEENVFRIKDNSLFKEINMNRKSNPFVHKMKAAYNKAFNFIFKIDHRDWISKSYKICSDLIENNDIDLIFTCYAPISTLELGYKLKKRFPKVKWIVDIRDDFINNFECEQYTKKFAHLIDGLTTVSDPIISKFKERSNSEIRYFELKNGYNFPICEPKRNVNDIFTITYSGTFYGKINPNNFLKAVSDLKQEGHLNQIRLNFIGVIKPFNIPSNLKDNVYLIEKRISYNQNIEKLKQSDCLLLILPKAKEKGVYSGKLFDYLGVARPILGLVPDDVARELIKNTNSGYYAENENIEEIKQIILQSYNDWKLKKEFVPNQKEIKKLHRFELVKEFEKFIKEIVKVTNN